MSSLLLIGIILFVSVLLIDIMVRIGIVCFKRKQKRVIKPLGVVQAQGNNRNAGNTLDAITEDAHETRDEDIENRPIPSV